jgi:hypothetical protein
MPFIKDQLNFLGLLFGVFYRHYLGFHFVENRLGYIRNMKIEEIKIGYRYRVKSVDSDGHTPWEGTVKVISLNPPDFQPETIEAVCEGDNITGYFPASDFVEEIDRTPQDFIDDVLKLCED